MAMMDRSTGCCGWNFERQHVSVIGMLTFSMPYVVLYLAFYPLIFLVARVFTASRKSTTFLADVYRANLKAINESHILPRARCALGGRLFDVSPALAGLCFKGFNMALLGSVWFAVLGSATSLYVLLA